MSKSGTTCVARRANDTIVKRILQQLKIENDEDRLALNRFILDLPELNDFVMEYINECCKDLNRTKFGLTTLRDIVIARPPYRQRSLEMLLEFAKFRDDTIRSLAIRLIVNRLYLNDTQSLQEISIFIEEFATTLLYELISLNPQSAMTDKTETKEEANKEVSEEEVRRYLFLYCALCTKKHELLSNLIDVYTQMSPNVKKIMHQECLPTIRAIGLHSPYIS